MIIVIEGLTISALSLLVSCTEDLLSSSEYALCQGSSCENQTTIRRDALSIGCILSP